MPRIGEAFGIIFYVYFKDHAPPHFHAVYQGQEAEIEIATGRLLGGNLPPAKLRRARSWLTKNRAAIQAAWDEFSTGGTQQ